MMRGKGSFRFGMLCCGLQVDDTELFPSKASFSFNNSFEGGGGGRSIFLCFTIVHRIGMFDFDISAEIDQKYLCALGGKRLAKLLIRPDEFAF